MGTPRLRPVLSVLLAASVLGTLAVAAAPAASADTGPQFCTLDLSTGSFTCSDTPGTQRARLSSSNSVVILGRFYDDPNKVTSNGYFDVTASSGCDTSGDLDWAVNVMPSGWNDRISSFQAYANCDVRLFSNGFLSGSVYGPATSANTLGSMDNQTSSIGFY